MSRSRLESFTVTATVCALPPSLGRPIPVRYTQTKTTHPVYLYGL